ncbi:phage tail protein [Phnomibacter sp. MR]|uniref:phage tail protein n=1 Tax=Phnomibacter sp. MR TaxID=3042318 RepID=UPI003A80E9D5
MPNNEPGNWPLPKFYFAVQFGDDAPLRFQEVTGLNAESQVIEYRHGNSPVFATTKMPGLVKYGNVTLKKGIFNSDSKLWDWMKEIKMNSIERMTVTISLLDENDSPTITWTLANAWPTKISSSDITSDGDEVAVETLEIAHEGLTIAQG